MARDDASPSCLPEAVPLCVLTALTEPYYHRGVETIIFKAPTGTKAKLRRLNRNVSALLRAQVQELIRPQSSQSAYAKAEDLCGVIKGGPKNAATSKDYLRSSTGTAPWTSRTLAWWP